MDFIPEFDRRSKFAATFVLEICFNLEFPGRLQVDLETTSTSSQFRATNVGRIIEGHGINAI